jgi:hypothetical protein
MGTCKQLKPLEKGIVVFWGGNVMCSICPDCFPNTPLYFKRTPDGVRIEAVTQSLILPATNLSNVKALSELAPTAKKCKFEFGEE